MNTSKHVKPATAVFNVHNDKPVGLEIGFNTGIARDVYYNAFGSVIGYNDSNHLIEQFKEKNIDSLIVLVQEPNPNWWDNHLSSAWDAMFAALPVLSKLRPHVDKVVVGTHGGFSGHTGLWCLLNEGYPVTDVGSVGEKSVETAKAILKSPKRDVMPVLKRELGVDDAHLAIKHEGIFLSGRIPHIYNIEISHSRDCYSGAYSGEFRKEPHFRRARAEIPLLKLYTRELGYGGDLKYRNLDKEGIFYEVEQLKKDQKDEIALKRLIHCLGIEHIDIHPEVLVDVVDSDECRKIVPEYSGKFRTYDTGFGHTKKEHKLPYSSTLDLSKYGFEQKGVILEHDT